MAHLNSTDDGLRELALFAGAGGGILGGKLLGWRTVCAVEWEPYPAAVLARRQDEGFLPPFPIWDDVQTFDGKPWRGLVDVVSGGFPCQDISIAGKGDGLDGERSGLWTEMARIIGEVRPRYALVENSPVLTSRGLDVVLGDLAAMGYDAEWGVLGVDDAGGTCRRERLWIVAGTNEDGQLHEFGRSRMERSSTIHERRETEHGPCGIFAAPWPGRPEQVDAIPRVVDGLSVRMDYANACVGNAQSPAVVRLAWHTLHERLMNR